MNNKLTEWLVELYGEDSICEIRQALEVVETILRKDGFQLYWEKIVKRFATLAQKKRQIETK